jgi:hypothetical protein
LHTLANRTGAQLAVNGVLAAPRHTLCGFSIHIKRYLLDSMLRTIDGVYRRNDAPE